MKSINFTILFLLSFTAKSQHVIYSDPEKISLTTRSEVIGKVGDNIFVCDLLKNKYQLRILDRDLKEKRKIELNFIPAATYRLHFINYPDHCLAIFQSVESKKKIHVSIANLDKDGQLGKIISVDSISAGTYGGNEFYTVNYSENKEHLLLSRRVIGIKPDKIQVDQVILNNKLEVEKNENYFISYERGQLMSDLNIDDNGNIVFMTYPPAIEEDQGIKFYKLPFNSGDLMIKDILIKDNELSEPQIKINNKKNLYYLTSLYQDKNTKAVAGLLSIILNYDLTDYNTPLAYAFSNPKKSKGKTQRQKNLFDNYFIRDIIFREDGGLVIAGTTIKSDGIAGTSNPKLISMNDIYATKNSISNGPTRRGGVNYTTQDIAINYSFDPNNITAYNPSVNSAPKDNYYGSISPVSSTNAEYDVMIISVDKNNHVINTSKINDRIPLDVKRFGIQKMNLGNEVYILFNNAMKYNNFLLNSISVNINGDVEPNPLFRNLDRGYTFLVESGKQLDMSTMIVPCEKNNKKAFAMIRFD
jgi:hypothetical protein